MLLSVMEDTNSMRVDTNKRIQSYPNISVLPSCLTKYILKIVFNHFHNHYFKYKLSSSRIPLMILVREIYKSSFWKLFSHILKNKKHHFNHKKRMYLGNTIKLILLLLFLIFFPLYGASFDCIFYITDYQRDLLLVTSSHCFGTHQ
jgi:uncharacterized membrane protein